MLDPEIDKRIDAKLGDFLDQLIKRLDSVANGAEGYDYDVRYRDTCRVIKDELEQMERIKD
jgi:hypothetical protein